MNLNLSIYIGVMVMACFPGGLFAACQITKEGANESISVNDAMVQLFKLEAHCPKNVFEFRALLKANQLNIHTTFVANEGYHHQASGSFSLFEIVTGTINNQHMISAGDFMYGHFTALDDNHTLIADQTPVKNKLMIEVLAFDETKKLYNFYELRGNGKAGQWYYRGDSADIFKDNAYLHLQMNPNKPQFGERLRCSGCHQNGGPIMKELAAPHNDWWDEKRPFDFNNVNINNRLREMLVTLTSAKYLAASVKAGIKKLNQPHSFSEVHQKQSLPELLRPLFCPQEINFKSDITPNAESLAQIFIPLGFFLDERLISENDKKPIEITRQDYEYNLKRVSSHFPNTLQQDADHAWLTPVKASADKVAVKALIDAGIINYDFVIAVLSIDFTNPSFSRSRCSLLKFVPSYFDLEQPRKARHGAGLNWQQDFINQLIKSNDKHAIALARALSDSTYTTKAQMNAASFLNHCRIKLRDKKHVNQMFDLLLQRRRELKENEISANPKGEILEPSFRVIFPTTREGKQRYLKLTQACDIRVE